MSIKWHGIIQLSAPLIQDDNEDEEAHYNHEDCLLRTQNLGHRIKQPLFKNAAFAISHFVKFASARSHECRQQKDNQRQFRERRKQTQR